jgi:hypothetical protein
MNTEHTIFAQVMDYLPHWQLQKYAARYDGERKVQHFSCLVQLGNPGSNLPRLARGMETSLQGLQGRPEVGIG